MDSKIQTAVVTGASSGLGREYCYSLAKCGVDLVVVARDTARLTELQQELCTKYKVQVHVVVQDLAKEGAARSIYLATQQLGLRVDLLINNAGYADGADFVGVSWEMHHAMLQVMLYSVVELTHLYLADMLRRKNGYIINVASVVGLVKLSLSGRLGRTLYRPIKTFIVQFTEQLASIYRGSGVLLQCLCPGLTITEFHQRSGDGGMYKSTPKMIWKSSAFVVDKSLRALGRRKKTLVVPGVINKVFVFIAKVTRIFI